MHVRQSEVAAGVAIGKSFVVESEQVQDGGVQVVDVNLVFDGREAELVRCTMNIAAACAAAGEPHAEAIVIMVAAAELRQRP